MDSQGPSLSKGFPEQDTGASDLSENSNGRSIIFLDVYNLLYALFSRVLRVLNVFTENVINSFSCCQLHQARKTLRILENCARKTFEFSFILF